MYNKLLTLTALSAALAGWALPASATTLEDVANTVFTTGYTRIAAMCTTGTTAEKDACRSAKIKQLSGLLTSRTAALNAANCVAPIACPVGQVMVEGTTFSSANCPLSATCKAGTAVVSGTTTSDTVNYNTPGSSNGETYGSGSVGSSSGGGLGFGGGGGSGASSGGGSGGGGVNYGSSNSRRRGGAAGTNGGITLGPIQSVGSPQLYTFSPAQADPLLILYSLPGVNSGGNR